MSFDCKRCGHCCEGSGGIVVSASDLKRLCTYFNITASAFLDSYGEEHGGKLKIKNGKDGRCIFFKPGLGCGIHVAKPDICRAWPYFRGNLVSADSLELAKDYCPGIPAYITFKDFVKEGVEYIIQEQLIVGGEGGASALDIADIMSAIH